MVRMSRHCGMQRPFIDSTVAEKGESMSRIFVALFIATAWLDAYAQSSSPPSALPKCSGDKSSWNDCFGTLTTADGLEYVGEIVRGLPNGVGALKSPSGQYVGDFQDGKFHGQGVMTWPDGTKYVGGFRNSERHGEGRQTYQGGALYSGQWKNNKRHGYGVFDYGNGNIAKGAFQDDKAVQPEKWSTVQRMGWAGYRPGKTYYWNLPIVLQSTLPPCPDTTQTPWSNCFGEKKFIDEDLPASHSKYVGEFKNNAFHGQGHFVWTNGNQYVGQWRNGLPHGAGTLLEPTTARHVGEWRYGKRSGRGKYFPTSEQEACVLGVWEEDILVLNAASATFLNAVPETGCAINPKDPWVDDSEGWVGLKR